MLTDICTSLSFSPHGTEHDAATARFHCGEVMSHLLDFHILIFENFQATKPPLHSSEISCISSVEFLLDLINLRFLLFFFCRITWTHVRSIWWHSVPDSSSDYAQMFQILICISCKRWNCFLQPMEVHFYTPAAFLWEVWFVCKKRAPQPPASDAIWVICAQSTGLVWSLRSLRIWCWKKHAWWWKARKIYTSVNLIWDEANYCWRTWAVGL